MKQKSKSTLIGLIQGKPDKPPAGYTDNGKGNWKLIDGDWAWVPVDDKGVPYEADEPPVLPGRKKDK